LFADSKPRTNTRRIVQDIFGAKLKIGGRLDPGERAGGLYAIGAGRISVATSGLEQYDAIARTAAAQIVDERHRPR